MVDPVLAAAKALEGRGWSVRESQGESWRRALECGLQLMEDQRRWPLLALALGLQRFGWHVLAEDPRSMSGELERTMDDLQAAVDAWRKAGGGRLEDDDG